MSGTGGEVGTRLVREAAQLYAPDQYLSALLAPADARDDLVALAAFTGEVQRVAVNASDPQIGEIRLVWWRDAVTAGGLAASAGPVADAFGGVVARRGLDRQAIDEMIAAEARALYPQAPESEDALADDVEARDGTPMRLAAQILGAGVDDGVLSAAARAYGFARLARQLPYAAAAGRVTVPARNRFVELDVTEENAYLTGAARTALGTLAGLGAMERRARAALLPVALVEPYLRALQKTDYNPRSDLIEIAPVSRAWRLARAWMTGRI